MAELPIAIRTVLGVFSAIEDRQSLQAIFSNSLWKLELTGTLSEAQAVLRSSRLGVVISESSLTGDYGWKDLLHSLQNMEDPPPLIVADRLADERLWAEVLNLGAYDLLTMPLDGREVLYVVTAACRHRENGPGMAVPRKRGMSSQSGSTTELAMSAAHGR